jgi:hypothetical protein
LNDQLPVVPSCATLETLPMAIKGSNTLREAEKAIRRRFAKDGIR